MVFGEKLRKYVNQRQEVLLRWLWSVGP